MSDLDLGALFDAQHWTDPERQRDRDVRDHQDRQRDSASAGQALETGAERTREGEMTEVADKMFRHDPTASPGQQEQQEEHRRSAQDDDHREHEDQASRTQGQEQEEQQGEQQQQDGQDDLGFHVGGGDDDAGGDKPPPKDALIGGVMVPGETQRQEEQPEEEQEEVAVVGFGDDDHQPEKLHDQPSTTTATSPAAAASPPLPPGGVLHGLRGILRRPPGPAPDRSRSRWRIRISFRGLLLAGSVVAVLAIGLVSLMRETPEIAGRLPSQPALDATPGGAVQEASPEYRDALATSNDAGTQEALETDAAAFIPTTEALPIPITEATSTEFASPDPARPVVDAGRPPADDSAIWLLAEEAAANFDPLPPIPGTPAGFAAPEITEVPNPMLEQLAALADRPLPRMGSQRFSEPPPVMTGGGGLPDGLAGLPPPAAPADSLRLLGLRVGDTARARMMLGLSSDLPGPAIAEITTGPLTGARVSGSFAVHDAAGGLQLQFASISLPDGRDLPIQAIGLSPWTGGQVTRSRRDPRLLQRYGGLAAAGAVSGAATAVATPSTRTTIADGAVVVEQSEVTRRQVIASALAPAAGAVASDLASRTAAGPLIELDQGAPIVVLFTATAGAETPPGGAAAGLAAVPGVGPSLPLLQLLAEEALQTAPGGGQVPPALPTGLVLPALEGQ